MIYTDSATGFQVFTTNVIDRSRCEKCDYELPTVSGVPQSMAYGRYQRLCDPCYEYVRDCPQPNWITLAAMLMSAAIVGGMIWGLVG